MQCSTLEYNSIQYSAKKQDKINHSFQGLIHTNIVHQYLYYATHQSTGYTIHWSTDFQISPHSNFLTLPHTSLLIMPHISVQQLSEVHQRQLILILNILCLFFIISFQFILWYPFPSSPLLLTNTCVSTSTSIFSCTFLKYVLHIQDWKVSKCLTEIKL